MKRQTAQITFSKPLKDRLARLVGQAEALQRMVEQPTDWNKLLELSAAIGGAADQVTADLYREFLASMDVDEAIAVKAKKGLDLVLKRQ